MKRVNLFLSVFWCCVLIALSACKPYVLTSVAVQTATSVPIQSEKQEQLTSPRPTSTVEPVITSTTPANQLSPVLHNTWTSYTNANYIRALFLDRDGYLWSGGSGGVVRWDIASTNYIKYTSENGLPGNNVTSIAQGADGSMWFGTCNGGAALFDGTSWTIFTRQDGLLEDCVLSIEVAEDGSVWFGSRRGVSQYDGSSWKHFDEINTGGLVKRADILKIAPDGTLWAGGLVDEGLHYFDGEGWNRFNPALDDVSITALAFSPDNTLWVSDGMDLYRARDGVLEKFYSLSNTDPNDIVVISSIVASSVNDVWISYAISEDFGIFREANVEQYHKITGVSHFDGETWSICDTDDGLVTNEIRTMIAGSDGSIWFGSYNQGISHYIYEQKKWTTYKTGDTILSNYTTALHVSDQNIVWTGHPYGVSTLIGLHWETFREFGALEFKDIYTLRTMEDGSLWISTFDGVAQFKSQKWTSYSNREPGVAKRVPRSVSVIAKGEGGNVLFGSWSGGLTKFDGKEWLSIPVLQNIGINVITPGIDGSLWVGSSIKGIYQINRDKLISHITKNDGLSDPFIRAIAFASDGTMWVGTNEGLSSLAGNKWITHQGNDCFEPPIADIVADKNGGIWIGSDIGLCRYKDNEWTLFTTKDGLAETWIRDIDISGDGSVWIATPAGISKYVP